MSIFQAFVCFWPFRCCRWADTGFIIAGKAGQQQPTLFKRGRADKAVAESFWLRAVGGIFLTPVRRSRVALGREKGVASLGQRQRGQKMERCQGIVRVGRGVLERGDGERSGGLVGTRLPRRRVRGRGRCCGVVEMMVKRVAAARAGIVVVVETEVRRYEGRRSYRQLRVAGEVDEPESVVIGRHEIQIVWPVGHVVRAGRGRGRNSENGRAVLSACGPGPAKHRWLMMVDGRGRRLGREDRQAGRGLVVGSSGGVGRLVCPDA